MLLLYVSYIHVLCVRERLARTAQELHVLYDFLVVHARLVCMQRCMDM